MTTIWREGVDDELVRAFVGGGKDWRERFIELPAPQRWVLMNDVDFHHMVYDDGPTFGAAPAPPPYQPPRPPKPKPTGKKPYEPNVKDGFGLTKNFWEARHAPKVLRKFGISTFEKRGSKYFFQVTNSFVHKKKIRAHPSGTNHGSKVIRELKLAPLSIRGVVKGAFWDIVITGAGMGVDYAIARYIDHNQEKMEEIAGSFWKEMGKAALSSALAAGAAAAAAATGVVFLPLVAGLVVGIAAGCVLDELDPNSNESSCRAFGRAIGSLFSSADPAPARKEPPSTFNPELWP